MLFNLFGACGSLWSQRTLIMMTILGSDLPLSCFAGFYSHCSLLFIGFCFNLGPFVRRFLDGAELRVTRLKGAAQLSYDYMQCTVTLLCCLYIFLYRETTDIRVISSLIGPKCKRGGMVCLSCSRSKWLLLLRFFMY